MERFDDLLSGIHSATITEVSVLVRELQVRIGVLAKPVSIRIYFDSKREEPYRFELSSRMMSPGEREPSDADGNAPSESEALRRAVRTLTQNYESAVRQGHLPDESWLVDGDGV